MFIGFNTFYFFYSCTVNLNLETKFCLDASIHYWVKSKNLLSVGRIFWLMNDYCYETKINYLKDNKIRHANV